MDTNNSPASAPLTLSLEYLRRLNLAVQQNSFPAVRALTLKNTGTAPLSGLSVRLTAVPAFFSEKTIAVGDIPPGEEITIHPELELSYEFLSGLTEKVMGTITAAVYPKTVAPAAAPKTENPPLPAPLTAPSVPVEVYAADQWLSLMVMPELICAFVTPNMEIIARLAADVARELQAATGDGSLDGYQSRDPQRVYAICAAAYRAIAAWNLTYCEPAASFTTDGQRVRFADNLYKFRMGTCLDTTLLFASVLEQCGLHPVIMLYRGHANIGCHLRDCYFPDVPVDDLQTIRKRVDLDEFAVIETTAVTGEDTFSDAENTARRQLNNDEDFECAIDVRRARISGVLPLPLKKSVDGLDIEPVSPDARKMVREEARSLRPEIDISALTAAQTLCPRLDRWQNQLLDLSLRNRLLNTRNVKQVIPLVCPDLAHLEDVLADDRAFTISPLEKLLSPKEGGTVLPAAAGELTPAAREILLSEQKKNHLWSALPENELGKRLLAVYRQSRTDIEEGGVNTLFLAIGFLRWTPDKRKNYYAPLLLLPISIKRSSARGPVTITRTDEDMVLNVTLLELLRREQGVSVPGLEPLPADDHGVDVEQVLAIFRTAVKNIPGFEVIEEVSLGLFSFSKFVMWNDLVHRAEDLRHNPLVAHLIDGGGTYDDGITVFAPQEIEKNIDWADLYCPLPADATQLTAVRYAAMGKSFVLHGPPGTGKSQTIANLIADNLARGRRVLFVSEKKAALDVVQRRLTAIGLRPFCLELHSHRAGKTEVLAQFAEALAYSGTDAPAAWAETVRRLEQERTALNAYVADLHRKYPNGLSVYHCFAKLLARELSAPHTPPAPAAQPAGTSAAAPESSRMNTRTAFAGLLNIDCLQQTAAALTSARTALNEYIAALRYVAPEMRELFAGCGSFVPDAAAETALRNAGSAAAAATAELLTAAKAVSGDFLGAADDYTGAMTAPAAAALSELAATVWEGEGIPPELIAADLSARETALRELLANGQKLAALQKKLGSYRMETLASIDIDGIRERLQANHKCFFLVRFFRNRALLQELRPLRRPGAPALIIETLTRDLDLIQQEQSLETILSRTRDGAVFGSLWQGAGSDWTVLAQALERAAALQKTAGRLTALLPGTAAALRPRLAAIFADPAKKTPANSGDGNEAQRGQTLKNAVSVFQKTARELAGALHTAVETLGAGGTNSAAAGCQTPLFLAVFAARAQKFAAHAGELRRICLWKRARAAAAAAGMEGLLQAVEAGRVAPEKAAAVFVYAYYSDMAAQATAAVPRLRDFLGPQQNERVRRFRELDAAHTALARNAAIARVAQIAAEARSGKAGKNSELGILRHECEKKRLHKPVRKLLELLPTLAVKLKPCFLMSPLSVAQYLPADGQGFADFDLVVFDEASQIPVWDAVGVIARGKQLIVVGDQKQMPPTSFFQKSGSEADADAGDAGEDLESILDECIAAGISSSHLLWHYRSRHETLIAFSNRYYYGGKLFTFPAAQNPPWLGVRRVFVENSPYTRKTRTNRGEAAALVAHVISRLQDPATAQKSIGIVTFNQAQKDLIEDLLEEQRALHPELDAYFADTVSEPLFVKNLENVQGDERDVILFSIGYAPDADGRFYMNFGPLNRQGGERRLNVAVTRAKEQVIVFTAVESSRIDLDRTAATGAAHLKAFLQYAEQAEAFACACRQNAADNPGGGQTPATAISAAAPGGKELFMSGVADFLRGHGYTVATNVGCSAYRIDVAVLSPDRPGVYVLGIEGDGAAYCRNATARDRENTRAAVLQSLGWKLHRVWIPEWWHDPEAAQAELLQAVQTALKTEK